jgi:hypothetical protein
VISKTRAVGARAGEWNLKTAFLVIMLVAASGATAAFAKDARGHLAHRSPGAAARKSDAEKVAVKPSNTDQHETVEAPAVNSAPRSNSALDGGRVHPHVEIAPPANSLAHRMIVPPGVITHNALGMTVGPAAAAAAKPPRPIVNASIAGQNRPMGVGLIRPVLARSGLGGPAKTMSGINGTTLRLKH